MRRAFGPSQSHAFFFSLGPPFCTEGWAPPLSGSGHIWMCLSCQYFSFLRIFCSIREFGRSGVMMKSFHFVCFWFLIPFFHFYFFTFSLISTLSLQTSFIFTSSSSYFVFWTFFFFFGKLQLPWLEPSKSSHVLNHFIKFPFCSFSFSSVLMLYFTFFIFFIIFHSLMIILDICFFGPFSCWCIDPPICNFFSTSVCESWRLRSLHDPIISLCVWCSRWF